MTFDDTVSLDHLDNFDKDLSPKLKGYLNQPALMRFRIVASFDKLISERLTPGKGLKAENHWKADPSYSCSDVIAIPINQLSLHGRL
jgi:hypothetical protein